MTTKPLQLRAGAYYRRRDGKIVGPCVRNIDAYFPWSIGDITYRETGRFSLYRLYPVDLIAEVPAPTKRKVKAKRPTRRDFLRALALVKRQYAKAIKELAEYDERKATK